MFGLGWGEILVIVVVVLLLFGARRIPEVMRSLGKGVKEFKKGMKDISTDDEEKPSKGEPPKQDTSQGLPKS